jgi:hypothetical protein
MSRNEVGGGGNFVVCVCVRERNQVTLPTLNPKPLFLEEEEEEEEEATQQLVESCRVQHR